MITYGKNQSVVSFEAAAAAQAEKQAKDAESTAALKGFVDGGCKTAAVKPESQKQEASLDLTVCRQHWMRACLSPNRAPGQTVVPFSQFTTALVYAKQWKAGDMRAAGICKAIMAASFPSRHVKGATYEPLPIEVRDGNVHQYICESVIKDRIKQMNEMELTAENCFLAAFDLQAIARYYVETIIDAAKTGKIVVIENVDNFDAKKEFSRQDLAFHVDWDTRVVAEDWKPRRLGKGQSYILDVFQGLRKGAMAKAEAELQELAKLEQKLPDDTWAWVKKTALDPECRKYILFCKRMKEMYWSLNNIKKSYDKMLQEGIDGLQGSAIVELRNEGVKEAYNAAFDHLRDQIRLTLADVTPLHRVALLVYVTFMYRNPRETKKQISSFAQQMLEEEFFQWVLMIYLHDKKVPKFTEDALEKVRGFDEKTQSEEERTVEFVFGQYESEDGSKVAIAKSPELDGEYIVRKSDGRWVASRKIRDLVKIPVPSENTLTFITKMREDLRTEAADHDGCFDLGKTVTLLRKAHVGGGKFEDAVVVDGVSVTEFRCDSRETTDDEGQPLRLAPKEQKAGFRWVNDEVLRNLYDHMQGEVDDVVGAKIPGDRGRDQYIAIVTLKNVRKVVDVKVTETTKGAKPKAAAKVAKKDVQFHSTFLGQEV